VSDPALQQALDQARGWKQKKNFALARAGFEDPLVAGRVAQLPAEERFAYSFDYGTLLGEMGELEAMDRVLTEALGVAAEVLEDVERCKQVWVWLLHWCRHHQEWVFLENQCRAAHEWGKAVGSASIRQMAAEFCAYAHRGQGRIDEARIGAETIARRLEAIGADEERVSEWRDFLSGLSETGEEERR